ncbi:beta-phosphoglucomutase [Oscillospiraceae bacterium HV4-5-C5C]|nr:beta-phosphoglucomutase [Oscillospiraceae bacterium HV4-5-C5C]
MTKLNADGKPVNSPITDLGLHPWKLIETQAKGGEADRSTASIMSLGNGHIGLRAWQEDDLSQPGDGLAGTFINGFFESEAIRYGETAYGYARDSQTMMNLANPLPVLLEVKGMRLCFSAALQAGQISHYRRSWSMVDGTLTRSLHWSVPDGPTLKIESCRLVSLTEDNLALQSYRVSYLPDQSSVADSQVQLRLGLRLDAHAANRSGGNDPRVGQSDRLKLVCRNSLADASRALVALRQDASHAGLSAALAVAANLSWSAGAVKASGNTARPADLPAPLARLDDAAAPELSWDLSLTSRQPSVTLSKYIVILDQRDLPPVKPEPDLLKHAVDLACACRQRPLSQFMAAQKDRLARFWDQADCDIRGDLSLAQGLHVNLFHLLQSAGHNGWSSAAAKGLSGEGYEGHYFWDTEMYVFPFFLYTDPKLARQLLAYRWSILPQARQRASELGHSGALFAWRTIDGRECSAYFPAGTAQYHIDADIALACRRYYEATDDLAFMWEMGAEIILETARFWLSLGFYNQARDGAFCLQEVTGPDEYSALVNNNYYTNLMAQKNLSYAVALLQLLQADDPDRLTSLLQRLHLEAASFAGACQQAADHMFLPYDEANRLPLQDDQVLQRPLWDFAATPADQHPLLLHYHALNIYRHRVSKQADLLLAMYLWPSAFDPESQRRAYLFYEACTTHDSSLSAPIFAAMACRLGWTGHAYRYFMSSARLDLDDRQGNTADGVHLANMAGTWLALTSGFGGMSTENGQLAFWPRLPRQWEGYGFQICFKGNRIKLEIHGGQAVYQLLGGPGLTFSHQKQPVQLSPDRPRLQLPLAGAGRSINPADRHAGLKAVIFDVDGVLLSTDEEHYQAWAQICRQEGIYFDRSINQRLRGVSRRDCVDIILEKASRPYSETEKAALAQRKNQAYLEAVACLDQSSVLPGVVEFLQGLTDLGYRLASASSSRNAERLLAASGLADWFTVRIDGSQLLRSKPDPEVFLKAAQALQLQPADCLVVEDSAAGIQAAKAGGFRSLAVGAANDDWLRLQSSFCARSLADLNADELADW